jgi:histidinol-phosphate aminotransferase
MAISRRNFFRNLGAGAIAGAAAPALRAFPLAPSLEHALWGNSAPAAWSEGVATAAEPVLLYRNENPYGPSEKVVAAMRESAAGGNRYPRTEYDTLVDKLAALHKVKREQIVLGCGSGEILCMAAIAFLKPGKKLVEAAPTFPALGKLAQTAGIEVVDVPLNKRYEHDLPVMLSKVESTSGAAASSSGTGLVYIVNPNNPTGTTTPRKDIEAFIAKLPGDITVLIDEAYHHFASLAAITNPSWTGRSAIRASSWREHSLRFTGSPACASATRSPAWKMRSASRRVFPAGASAWSPRAPPPPRSTTRSTCASASSGTRTTGKSSCRKPQRVSSLSYPRRRIS